MHSRRGPLITLGTIQSSGPASQFFSQYHRRPKETPDGGRYMGYSMHTKNYHYIEWYVWDDEGKSRGPFVAAELYDRLADPHETVNIAGEANMKKTVELLSVRLAAGWKPARPPRSE